MADVVDREQVRRRLKAFLVQIIDAKGPKVVARDLTTHGWPYEEGTVRTWRGTKNPPPDVVFALAGLYGSSIDQHVFGEPEEQRLRDQVAALVEKVDRLEGKLVGWQLELETVKGKPWGEVATERQEGAAS